MEVIYEFCAFIVHSLVNNRMQTMFEFNVVLKLLSGCEIAIGYNHCVLTKTFYKLLQKELECVKTFKMNLSHYRTIDK